MVKVLTWHEASSIMREHRVKGQLSEYRGRSEYLVYLPPALGQGRIRTIKLRPGLSISVVDAVKDHELIDKIPQHSADMPLVFSYYLAGGCRVDNDGLAGEVEETAGKSYLYHLPNTGEVERHPAGRHQRFRIYVAPELMYGFSDRIDEFPIPLRNSLENPTDSILYHPGCITPAQSQIIQQILEWPYQGLARHLFLEGKVLELIALHLGQVLLNSPQSITSANKRDIDRIYAARDILIQNVAAPPSLTELAQHVELSVVKLTRGFRQVFSTSVFNYLHDYRMEKACQLLQTGSLNIQEVARSIGYNSRSAFIAAFKKKYNMLPSVYLRK